MKRFLLKIASYIVPVILFYYGLQYFGYMPILSDSVSYDAKILATRKLNLKNIDVITLGSSVALNDINSAVIAAQIKSSYYNMAAWGVKMMDLDYSIHQYVGIYHPRYVILASNFADFQLGANSTFPDLYVSHWFLPYYYFKDFTGFNGLAERKNELKVLENNIHEYNCLRFDNNGGVALDVGKKSLSIGRQRFIDSLITIFPGKETNDNYNSLSNIAQYLKVNGIKLIFVQAPYVSYYLKTAGQRNAVASHFNRCQAIVERNGGLYLDYYTHKLCADSLFADQLHLSGGGAAILTQQLVKDISPLVK